MEDCNIQLVRENKVLLQEGWTESPTSIPYDYSGKLTVWDEYKRLMAIYNYQNGKKWNWIHFTTNLKSIPDRMWTETVKWKILKHLRENIGEYICELRVGKNFLNTTLKDKSYRKQLINLSIFKLRMFSRDIKQMKRQTRVEEWFVICK